MTNHGSDDLGSMLHDILRATPGGLSEHELFKRLADRGDNRFEAAAFHDPLTLYRAHFLLFHTLYRLQEDLWRKTRASLQITPLCICLRTTGAAPGTRLDEPDPLRAYYLDAENLTATTADDLGAMLDRFWAGLAGDEQRRQALAVLGLEDPVDDSRIKATYRRLAMAHHPDRGGDTSRLQALNAAMDTLTRLRRR